MAVTGFEVDVLRKNNGTGKTESVPAYESYNHHYGVGLHSTAVKMKLDENGQATGRDNGHGKMLEFELRDDVQAPPADAKLAQSFVHGNGQEHRQLFHGAPPGYAQSIYAPGTFVVTPMQISTNDGAGRKTGFDWLLPAIKRAGGKTPADPAARYAPLLECPCTTRIERSKLVVNGDCRAEPLSDLLNAYGNGTANPTCEAATYVGGLSCCHNGAFLLDADQEVPAFVDEVFFRFRFYYEDHNSAKHQELFHAEWAGNGCDSGCGGDCPNHCRHIEWDVVKGQGSKEGSDVSIFQSTFPAWDMLAKTCSPTSMQCFPATDVDEEKGFKLLMAATHCHAPNCIRQELINLDTGEVICYGKPHLGQSELNYDEEGYLFTPPCLWGDHDAAATGGVLLLPPPILHKNTTLRMVTVFNSTYDHPGQMGIWQMKGAPVV
jgi:hypothetical protein